MPINTVAALKGASRMSVANNNGQAFKKVLNKKFNKQQKNSSFTKVLGNINQKHKNTLSTIKNSVTKDKVSLDKLLKVQFKTGMFFVKEQMYCKTAELSANTFKRFTQMQV